jgi:hypothetical protein
VREAKRQEDEKLKQTFRAVGEEWATSKLEKENKAKSTIKRERWNLAQLNREIGDRPLCEIAPPELMLAFRRVEARDGTTPSGAYARPLRESSNLA